MRNHILLVVALALVGAGCTSTQRTEPPAPVYERGKRVGEAVSSGVETTALGAPEIGVGVSQETIDTPPPEPVTQGVRSEPAGTAVTAAASAQSPSVTSSEPVQVAYGVKPPSRGASTQALSSAGQALVGKADTSLNNGDLTGAASQLERAVRVEPGHPLPWNRLAHVRFAQGSYDLAEELAQKSNALAGSDQGLKRNNWLLISEARRAGGNIAGADEARRRADALN